MQLWYPFSEFSLQSWSSDAAANLPDSPECLLDAVGFLLLSSVRLGLGEAAAMCVWTGGDMELLLGPGHTVVGVVRVAAATLDQVGLGSSDCDLVSRIVRTGEELEAIAFHLQGHGEVLINVWKRRPPRVQQ